MRRKKMLQSKPPLSAFGSIAVALLVLYAPAHNARAQANQIGQWKTLSYLTPINPIHVGLMHTGQVLIVAGSENDPNLHNIKSSKAAVWDLGGGNIANGKITRTKDLTWDVFCNGWAMFPDGRCFVIGGTEQYDPFHGEPRTTVFDPLVDRSDPASHPFVTMQNMKHGRWYATGIVLPDGRIMAFSGLDETGATNSNVEFYTVGSATKNKAGETGWSDPFLANYTPILYPWMHVLPDGRVFNSGGSPTSRIFNPSNPNGNWQNFGGHTVFNQDRTYGSSVLLPLLPPYNDARVMILGGHNPATATTEIIDIPKDATSGTWMTNDPMPSGARIEGNSVLLPNGKLLVQGGSAQDNVASTATLGADMFDPATNTWSSAGTATYPRMYHSFALLLPDATVATGGSNPQRTVWEKHIEIYSPAYLFNADGSPATRPVISGINSNGQTPSGEAQITYGTKFTVSTPDAPNIASVVLIKPGSDTHAFDMEQRLVGLPFTVNADGVSLSVTGPPNPNIAPPGYYMLFVLKAGVPSVATFVQVVPATQLGDQPPKGQIISPSGDVTITAGQSVPGGFVGTATDTDGSVQSYSWVFEEGTPDSSAVPQPGGSIVFPNTGTFSVSLTAVDDKGVNDPNPPTRRVTVKPATITTYSISGTITNGAGATVTLSGTSSGSFTADSSGKYTLSGLSNGTYTVTPTRSGYTFSPASRSVTVNGANVTAVNFNGRKK
jgi:hypothetical protein